MNNTVNNHLPRFFAARIAVTVILFMCGPACDQVDNRLEFPEVGPVVTFDREGMDEELLLFLDEQIAQIEQHPNSSALRGRLGMTFHVNELNDAAHKSYEQAATLDPYEFKWHYFGALLAADNGDYENALQKINVAVTIDPTYVAAWLWKGTWSIEIGSYEEAKSAFEQATKVSPSPAALIGTAHALIELGEHVTAVAMLEDLGRQFFHPQLYRQLARCYRELGNESKLAVANELAKYPGEIAWEDPLLQKRIPLIRGYGGRLARAQKLLQLNRINEAIAELDEIRAKFPVQPALISSYAWAYAARGTPELASEELLIGIEEYPDHQPFYTQLGDLMYLGGHYEDAMTLLARAEEFNPRDAQALELQAKVLIQLERMDEAVDVIDRSLQLGSENPAQLHLQLGTIAGTKEDWPTAINNLSRVVELDPRNAQGHVLLSHAYEASDQHELALQTLGWAQRLGIPRAQLEPSFSRITQAEETSE